MENPKKDNHQAGDGKYNIQLQAQLLTLTQHLHCQNYQLLKFWYEIIHEPY
jgi:hypothetical protein